MFVVVILTRERSCGEKLAIVAAGAGLFNSLDEYKRLFSGGPRDSLSERHTSDLSFSADPPINDADLDCAEV
jgi:hypothetical protein